MGKLKEVNKKIEETVVSGYKKVEDTVVGGYKKVEDKFVDKFLKKDSETIEEAKERIKKVADSLNIVCDVVDNLTEATITAYNNSEKGDTILLSPACASWDQYKCFEDRGDEFKNTVNNLL